MLSSFAIMTEPRFATVLHHSNKYRQPCGGRNKYRQPCGGR